MSSVVESVLFVFGLVALGYLAGALGYLKASAGEALSAFVVGVALPLLLFRTMAGIDFHGAAPWALWAAYFSTAAIAWLAGHLVMTRLFAAEQAAAVVAGMCGAYSNTVLVGIPFVLGVFGQPGFEVLALVIAIHLPVMMAVSIVLFAAFGRDGKEPLRLLPLTAGFLARLFSNPLIVGILSGLAWRFSGLALPGLADRFVDALADTALPLALFAVGLELKRFGIGGQPATIAAVAALKLFFMPAVALAIVWAFGLPRLTAEVIVITAAMPTGINPYLVAVQFGTGRALASSVMTATTAAAVATTLFWLWVVRLVFG